MQRWVSGGMAVAMKGWSLLLDRLFPRGLMLLDFDEHRLHPRALSIAFKAGPIPSYLEQLNAGIATGIAAWPPEPGEAWRL